MTIKESRLRIRRVDQITLSEDIQMVYSRRGVDRMEDTHRSS